MTIASATVPTIANIQPSNTLRKNKLTELFKNKKYVSAIGRRKTAAAQVRLYSNGKGRTYINNKEFRQYFPYLALQKIVTKPLDITKDKQNLDLSIKVQGGGLKAQSEAISLGIARVIVKFNEEYREKLKEVGLLTRDARIKERKKPGLKRARRAPQWQKR